MTTLGIDLASMPKDTAACVAHWKRGRAIAGTPQLGYTNTDIDALIPDVDVIGIDAPFGWPDTFRAAMTDWTGTA